MNRTALLFSLNNFSFNFCWLFSRFIYFLILFNFCWALASHFNIHKILFNHKENNTIAHKNIKKTKLYYNTCAFCKRKIVFISITLYVNFSLTVSNIFALFIVHTIWWMLLLLLLMLLFTENMQMVLFIYFINNLNPEMKEHYKPLL